LRRHIINRRLPVIFSLMIAAFLGISVVSAIASLTALRQLSNVNYDSSGLAVVQLRLHYNLMLSELKVLELHPSAGSVEQARLQFDIIYQRLRSLPKRPPYNSFLTAGELAQIDNVFERVKAEAPAFDAAEPDNAAYLIGVRGRLEPHLETINVLSGRVIQLAGEYRDQRRKDITRSTELLIVSTAGLVLTGLFFAFLLWQSRARLRKQNQALEKLTEQLINANKAKSEFLALMSHELRTPLNAVIGFSEMIMREVFGPIGDKHYTEYAKDIKLSGDHLLNLINDILDLSKIEAGQFRVNPSSFSLGEAIDEAVQIVAIDERGGDSRIIIETADDLGNLYADHRSFRHILINLLSNAEKYTPEGGQIRVSAQRSPDGGIEIRVSDTGIGIPEADIERVLEPFGQSRNNSELTHEGTGLGLALSKQLTELNCGVLKLQSTVDVGTTVSLRFPAAPGATPDAASTRR
jgi:signal transduction histidine kinase